MLPLLPKSLYTTKKKDAGFWNLLKTITIDSNGCGVDLSWSYLSVGKKWFTPWVLFTNEIIIDYYAHKHLYINTCWILTSNFICNKYEFTHTHTHRLLSNLITNGQNGQTVIIINDDHQWCIFIFTEFFFEKNFHFSYLDLIFNKIYIFFD